MKYSQTGADLEERTDVFAMPPPAAQTQVEDSKSETDEQLPPNLPALDSDAVAYMFSRDVAIQQIAGVASHYETKCYELAPLASQAQDFKTAVESLKFVNGLLEARIQKDEASFATMRQTIVIKDVEIARLKEAVAELEALRDSEKQQKAELDNLKVKVKHVGESVASFSKKLRMMIGERDEARDEIAALKDFHSKESVPRLELERVQTLLSEATLRLNAHRNENGLLRIQLGMIPRFDLLAQPDVAPRYVYGKEPSHKNASEPPHENAKQPSSDNKNFKEAPHVGVKRSSNHEVELPYSEKAKESSNKEVQAQTCSEIEDSSDNDIKLFPHEDIKLLSHEDIEQPSPKAAKIPLTADARVLSISNGDEQLSRLDKESLRQLTHYRQENQELRADNHALHTRLNWVTTQHRRALAELEAFKQRETECINSTDRDAARDEVLRARAARERVKQGEG